jgi:hypothetical protein
MKNVYTAPLLLLFLFLLGCVGIVNDAREIKPASDATIQPGKEASAATACPAVNTTGSILLGVYYGNQGWAMNDVVAMENWQCKKNAVLNMFTNWCNRTKVMDDLFNLQLIYIWNNKNIPMITWEPNCAAELQQI